MLLLHLNTVDEAAWVKRFRPFLPDMPIVRRGDDFAPSDVSYIFVWKPTADAFDKLDGLKVIMSLGAGVDALLAHPSLPPHPIVRSVEAQLTQSMTDYVVTNVGMHHRAQTRYLRDQKAKNWTQYFPPAANDICVGIMGLGELGTAAANTLSLLGYNVRGWSRSLKKFEGVTTFAGTDQFHEFLSETDILVNLLPLTLETENILNKATFSNLKRDGLKHGPAIINAARGGHQNEADILEALNSGLLGGASLDVFQTEPLANDSPLWEAPNCFITPHIAAISNPDSGAEYFARILIDHQNGKPLTNVVDRSRGY